MDIVFSTVDFLMAAAVQLIPLWIFLSTKHCLQSGFHASVREKYGIGLYDKWYMTADLEEQYMADLKAASREVSVIAFFWASGITFFCPMTPEWSAFVDFWVNFRDWAPALINKLRSYTVEVMKITITIIIMFAAVALAFWGMLKLVTSLCPGSTQPRLAKK